MEIFSTDPAITFFAVTIAIAGLCSLILLLLERNELRRLFIFSSTSACFGLASVLEWSGTGLLFWKVAFYGLGAVSGLFLLLLAMRAIGSRDK